MIPFEKIVIIHGISHDTAFQNLKSLDQLIEERVDTGDFELNYDNCGVRIYTSKNKTGATYHFFFAAGNDVPTISADIAHAVPPNAIIDDKLIRTMGKNAITKIL